MNQKLVIITGFVFILTIFFIAASFYASTMYQMVFQPPCPYVWHGGSPLHEGSCWCGKSDSYCMCTPSLAVECIIEYREDPHDADCSSCKLILVRRRDPPIDKYAIPGGFVQLGESAEMAVVREMKEEANMSLEVFEQFKLFSDPLKDKRRQTATMVFRAVVTNVKDLRSGDDAKAIRQVLLRDVLKLSLAFDHYHVLSEYIERYHPQLMKHVESKG